MEIRGIPNQNGTYTVLAKGGPKWLRRFVLWTFTLRNPREILVRDADHIIFDRLPTELDRQREINRRLEQRIKGGKWPRKD